MLRRVPRRALSLAGAALRAVRRRLSTMLRPATNGSLVLGGLHHEFRIAA